MQTIPRSTTGEAALTIARRLATSNPEARLACPACATSLKGANLDRHLRDKHPSVPATLRTDGDAELVLVGVDRRIRRSYATIVVLLLAMLGVMAVLDPGPVTAPDGGAAAIGDIVATPFVLVLGAGLLLLLVLAGLGRANVFRARLSVNDGVVRLRHRLGTGSRAVSLPAPVETGTLFLRRPPNGNYLNGGGASVEERTGAYLRIGSGRRAITVGCPTGTGLRKHWSGWASGPRRKWWDVNLSAPAFVELQYALADAGALAATA